MDIRVTGSAVVVDLVGEAEMERLGRALADWVGPGTVIGLNGPLGAGKTRLVRAVAEGLGVDPAAISSPTFVLIQEYEGRIPVFHFDTYRLQVSSEFERLGVDEYFDAGGVCLIEWADRVSGLLPPDAWSVRIQGEGDCRRVILEVPKPELFAIRLQEGQLNRRSTGA